MDNFGVLVEYVIEEARRFAMTRDSLQNPAKCKIRILLYPDDKNKKAKSWLHREEIMNASLVSDDVPVSGIVEIRSYCVHMHVREGDSTNEETDYSNCKPFCGMCVCVSGGLTEDNRDCAYSTLKALERFFDKKQFIINAPK